MTTDKALLLFIAVFWLPSLVIAALSYFEVACLSFRDWRYKRHAKRITEGSTWLNKRH